jgi:hypothetical protein
MYKKNLKPEKTNSTKHTGKQPPEMVELTEMVELSDDAMQQLVGGKEASFSACVGSCVACSC